MTLAVVNESAIDRSRVVVHIRPLKHLKTLYGYSFILLWSSLKSAFAPGILDILVDNFRTRDGMDKIMSDSWSEYSYLQNTSLLCV